MEITIKNFQKKIPINPKRIKKAILDLLSQEGHKISGEITICFVNDRRIKELNSKYLNKNKPTDVLTFEMGKKNDSGDILADMVISTDTAVRNARLFKTTSLYELNLYVVHGMLHLLGYDDKTARQRKIMKDKTENILNKLNINANSR